MTHPESSAVRRWFLCAALRIMVRPWLWRTALRFVAWPPWKSGPYLRFRYATMYGSGAGDPDDVVAFLRHARRVKVQ